MTYFSTFTMLYSKVQWGLLNHLLAWWTSTTFVSILILNVSSPEGTNKEPEQNSSFVYLLISNIITSELFCDKTFRAVVFNQNQANSMSITFEIDTGEWIVWAWWHSWWWHVYKTLVSKSKSNPIGDSNPSGRHVILPYGCCIYIVNIWDWFKTYGHIG